jgi:cyclohexanone monooxygenase
MTTAENFDPEALRRKYREERDKRLRADGLDQYLEMKGELAHYMDDPYVEPGFERDPLADEVEVAVIGGGFGGLLVGARLREAGVEDIRFIDGAGDFGGTWYWNRYPGIACDIESYIYLPLLEETGYMPKEKYATGAEILEHCQRIARRFDLYRDTCFQTRVEEVRWDEEEARWIISTNRGDRMKAHYVCMALGILNHPKLPGIPGIEEFKGHTFHTSRWDFAYTGGDSNGSLTSLRGKRVGIIGTGATAVQCVPHLGESAKHLYVFQRTPSSIDEKQNLPTDPEWVKTLEPGWHQKRIDNFHALTTGGYQEEDLVQDGWTEIIRKLVGRMQDTASRDASVEENMELADFEKMEQIRERVDAIVENPETAEALKPYYRQFCKRPCFHNEYLPTFNRANVTLVDTEGKGVERITEKGVVVDGREYELDCIIYASGFEVGTAYAQRAGYEVYGRDGLSLTEKWSEGVRTLHGIHTRGFPNCFFIMNYGQPGFTVNFTQMLHEAGKHAAFIIARALEKNLRSLEVSEQAESDWVDTVLSRAGQRSEFQQSCTPSYYNAEGQLSEQSQQNGFFFGEPGEFEKILEKCRAGGGMGGLEIA